MPTYRHLEWEYRRTRGKLRRLWKIRVLIGQYLFAVERGRETTAQRERNPIWSWERGGWVLSRQKIRWWPWLRWLTVWRLRTHPSLLSWSLGNSRTHSRAPRRWPAATTRCIVSTPAHTLTTSTTTPRTPGRTPTTGRYRTPTWAIRTTARTCHLITTTREDRQG